MCTYDNNLYILNQTPPPLPLCTHSVDMGPCFQLSQSAWSKLRGVCVCVVLCSGFQFHAPAVSGAAPWYTWAHLLVSPLSTVAAASRFES